MLSLAALLADPALGLRLLVPGPPDATAAEVVWVHSTELPDPGAYLRERELVLTNGLWLDTTRPAAFVANVVRAGAAGIVFGLRAERTSSPGGLVEACRTAGLPLAEISVEVPFTEVTRAAAAIYSGQRQEALAGMVQRGDALAAALAHGAGASGVLDVLRRDHDLPLAVVDRAGRLLAAAGLDERGLDAGGRQAAADALGRRPPPLEVRLDGTATAALFPVGSPGAVDAALLCLRPLAALGRAEQAALDQTARYLSLEVARQQAVQAIEMRFAGELLDMVLSGPQRAAEVPGRLRAFGVDPDGPLAVCAFALASGPGDDAPAPPGLAQAVTDRFLAEGLPAVVVGGTQDVVAVVPWRGGREGFADLVARLAEALSGRFGGRRVAAGWDDLAADARGLRTPLLRSREACRVLRRRGGGVAAHPDLGTYRLLLDVQDGERLRGIADGVLGPLRDHDRRRGGELERTLRAFLLDHDGQWNATAAALFVHVNTLRNRLARIAELTGRDVGRTADRVDLFLALEADAQAGEVAQSG